MMKILLSSNLVLELLLNRSGYVEKAEQLFVGLKSMEIEAYITNLCLHQISFYAPDDAVESTTHYFEKCFGDRVLLVQPCHLHNARSSSLVDFHSAIEVACAVDAALDAIVAISPNNFIGSNFPVFSVDEFLKRYRLQQCFDLNIDTLYKPESVFKNSSHFLNFFENKT